LFSGIHKAVLKHYIQEALNQLIQPTLKMLTLRQLFLNNNAQTTHFPLLLEFERAEGVYIYDRQATLILT
jgi:hypothetical protein